MPEGPIKLPEEAETQRFSLHELRPGEPDSIGAMVREVQFRGLNYAIYRSDRGVYVHFSDDKAEEQAQRAAYVKLSAQICELRYLTSQMRPSSLHAALSWRSRQDTLYDHNMGQALMLLMESVAQRAAGKAAPADETEQEAKSIAQRALDMAVRRNTVDNTIRYVRTCVGFGFFWLLVASAVYLLRGPSGDDRYYILASATGIIGAVFSVIVRAQSLDLKPCDESDMNNLMSLIRVGMGGIAGPALFLLLLTVAANVPGGAAVNLSTSVAGTVGFVRLVAIIGLIAGFAERLVPNLVQEAAGKMDNRAGTPGQAAQAGAAH